MRSQSTRVSFFNLTIVFCGSTAGNKNNLSSCFSTFEGNQVVYGYIITVALKVAPCANQHVMIDNNHVTIANNYVTVDNFDVTIDKKHVMLLV